MTLGERIKEQRKKKGFSQEKIAELVGTSRQAVTKWESGQSIPCMENLMTLAEIFGLPLDELSSGVNNNIPIAVAADVTAQDTSKKSTSLLDIIFVLVAVLAVWSIFRIPAYIGFSMVGFVLVIAQTAAILYVPLYLLWLRPRRLRTGVMSEATKDKAEIRNKIAWGAVSAVVQGIAFILIRYTFFEIHLMMQLPLILFILGIFAIGISAIIGTWKVMLGTVVGYIVGFILGMIIFVDVGRFDPNRGHYIYYGWWIWLLSFLGFIIASIIWTFIGGKRAVQALSPQQNKTTPPLDYGDFQKQNNS